MNFTWQDLETYGPGPRSRHCLWYDPERQVTILFGGLEWQSNLDAYFPPDTWMLRDGIWRRVQCDVSPPPRHRGAAAFDRRAGHAVLFGGQGGTNQFLGDTWPYWGGRWHRQRFWHGPSPRCGHALAYDEALECVVLFGGINPDDKPLGDTWLFDGSWHRGPSTGPPPRRYSAFAYDPDLEGCILHGGAVDDAGNVLFGDAWLLRAGAWQQLPSSFSTSKRDDHALAYHRAAKLLVMVGGLRADGLLVRSDDQWEQFDSFLPRLQCAPVTYDEQLEGLLLFGGETHHGGAQYHSTMLLRFTGDS